MSDFALNYLRFITPVGKRISVVLLEMYSNDNERRTLLRESDLRQLRWAIPSQPVTYRKCFLQVLQSPEILIISQNPGEWLPAPYAVAFLNSCKPSKKQIGVDTRDWLNVSQNRALCQIRERCDPTLIYLRAKLHVPLSPSLTDQLKTQRKWEVFSFEK